MAALDASRSSITSRGSAQYLQDGRDAKGSTVVLQSAQNKYAILEGKRKSSYYKTSLLLVQSLKKQCLPWASSELL
jgi:hypothetical protein